MEAKRVKVAAEGVKVKAKEIEAEVKGLEVKAVRVWTEGWMPRGVKAGRVVVKRV